ncbi:MAG: NCS2 family permease, partial [Nitrospinae bacterium]|nr:NCS2 family permease [Nitrospinota bacterium]
AVGIGLFITFIGFVQGGIVTDNPGTLVQLGNLRSLPALFTLSGVVVIAAMLHRKIKGAILIGMMIMVALGVPFGLVQYKGVLAAPPDIRPTWLQLDVAGALDLGILTIAAVFLFVDLFDTAGTLVGVGQQGGFLKDGKLPRATQALMPDAVATSAGALAGTSTVTCYIESAAGVAEGGRTGLAAVVTALLFLLALLFSPVAEMIGGGYEVRKGVVLYPITAPVLIIVGSLMVSNIVNIDWRRWDESLPSFLVLIGMPLTYSIADGMALGFISYPAIKVLCGKPKDVHWCLYLIAALFVLRYFTY